MAKVDPPNVAELKELYALISEDDAGHGGLCAIGDFCFACGGNGNPVISGRREIVENIYNQVRKLPTTKVLKIVRFVRVED
jgi:hypothetical protein